MSSAPCYAATLSDHSAIITPRHHTRPTQSTQTTISGVFDFGHIITEAAIVRGKRQASEATCHVEPILALKRSATINIYHRKTDN